VAKGLEQGIEQYRVKTEPFYAEVNGEIGLFKAAAVARMPVMLKGPTGCGKTGSSSTWHTSWGVP